MSESRILLLSDADRPIDATPFVAVANREEAADALGRAPMSGICVDRREFDAVLSDARWLRRRRNRLPVIALIEPVQIGRAAEILAAGADEVVVRDAEAPGSIVSRVRTLERRRLGARRGARGGRPVHSPAMRACMELVRKARQSEATVLLQGETGTGKEVIAREIHAGGPRRHAAFVAINCTAFPETLLESELFGHAQGAFTGASRARRGHFEEASGGTLFLDEAGEISLAMQVKLLRAIQESKVRPLGTTREVEVDVRIIAATNRDLFHEVETGRFRRDLYYRLHVFPIGLPPLRARVEDISPLAREFLTRASDGPDAVAPDAARLLEIYAWPGNVRELENEMARVIATYPAEEELTATMLSPEIQGIGRALPPDPGGETLRETMARLEAWVLRRALDRHDHRRIATARSLGITRECLYKKLKRYGMQ